MNKFHKGTANGYVLAKAEELGYKIDPLLCQDIIWGYTGFPTFWRLGIDGDTPEECFKTQVNKFFAEGGGVDDFGHETRLVRK